MDELKFNKPAVIQKNPKIDEALIHKVESFEKTLLELEKEDTRTKYTLSHPLNTSTAYFFNK